MVTNCQTVRYCLRRSEVGRKLWVSISLRGGLESDSTTPARLEAEDWNLTRPPRTRLESSPAKPDPSAQRAGVRPPRGRWSPQHSCHVLWLLTVRLCVTVFEGLTRVGRKLWVSISLRGGLESDTTTTASLDTPAARSRSSGGRQDGGWGRS